MKYIKERLIIIISIISFVALFAAVFIIYNNSSYKPKSENIRLASLSPSITEFVYDTGLDKYLIANTTFCSYPEEAKNKEKIGTFRDINYEQIAKLNINTVILHDFMTAQKKRLEDMGIKVVVIKNNTIDDILSTYDILGDAFNIRTDTDKRKNEIISKINRVKNNIKINDNKTAVVSIFRNYGSEVTSFTAAGGHNIYNDVLNILNINNPFSQLPPYTEVSMESIISYNPDIIFDMYHGRDATTPYNDWRNIPLKAVKNNHIVVLTDHYLSVPGPRIDMIIERFAKEYEGILND